MAGTVDTSVTALRAWRTLQIPPFARMRNAARLETAIPIDGVELFRFTAPDFVVSRSLRVTANAAEGRELLARILPRTALTP
jgi:hypothetical protein